MDQQQNQNVSESPLTPSGEYTIPPSSESESKGQGYQLHVGDNGMDFLKKRLKSFLVGIGVICILIFLVFAVVVPYMRSRNPDPITLVYWGLLEDEAIYLPLFEEFKKKYPHVTIKYEKQDIAGLGRYIERLQNRIGSSTNEGEKPDIYTYHNSWLPLIKNILEPLPSDVVASTQIDRAYYPVIKTDLSSGGLYYGLPLQIDTLVLFVNEELFEKNDITKTPDTWNDIVTNARSSVRYEGDSDQIVEAGVGMGTYENVMYATDIVSLLFEQNGADIRNLTGERRQFAEGALDFYVAFAKGGRNEKVWDKTLENSKSAFAHGRLAMYLGYGRDVLELRQNYPNLRFRVYQVPHVAGGGEARNKTIASYWVEGVASSSRHKKEAFALLAFLSEKDNLRRLYDEKAKRSIYGNPYPRLDMKDLLKDNPYQYPIVEKADRAVSTVFSSNTYDDSTITELNKYLGNAIISVNEGASPSVAIETLVLGVNPLLLQMQK